MLLEDKVVWLLWLQFAILQAVVFVFVVLLWPTIVHGQPMVGSCRAHIRQRGP